MKFLSTTKAIGLHVIQNFSLAWVLFSDAQV